MKMKKPALVLLMLIAALLVYFFWVNQNSKDMTIRQQLLKAFYPALMWMTRASGVNAKLITHAPESAPVPFSSLRANLLNGQSFDWTSLQGKKVLLVNTASDCGYTAQYAELQKLYELHEDRLVILAFPSNDFKEQEKGDAAAINALCQVNYGVRFPVLQKAVVVPGLQQHLVYQWLTKVAQNGWNSQAPSWNFAKYLVDEEGRLLLYADPSVSPLDQRLQQLIAR
jgi:glutathione peroxidase